MLYTELASQNLPLAGRIRYFKENWAKLTQVPWVLEAVEGYRVPFTKQPYQTNPPRELQHSQEEQAMLRAEIQTMLEKEAIEVASPTGMGFLSTIFIVPKKGGGQRPR